MMAQNENCESAVFFADNPTDGFIDENWVNASNDTTRALTLRDQAREINRKGK